MRGTASYLIIFLEGSQKRFVIPVYQRNYDWKKENCKQLFDDLVSVIRENKQSHFFGSIVSQVVPDGSKIEYHIIDGQQRLTTLTLMLSYLDETELIKGKLQYNIRKETQKFLEE